MNTTYEYKGNVYDVVPDDPDSSESPCRECAFDKDNVGCKQAPPCNPYPNSGRVHFVKRDGFVKLQPLRIPAATPQASESKPSNPKDALGVRKVAFSALPWRVLYNLGLGMMEGAAKYGRHNYRAVGVRASVYFDATVARHIGPWWEGEDIDPESGLHHIDKAIVSLMVMRDSMLQGNFIDDRPPRGKVNLAELNRMAGEVLDRHKDKSPHHYTIMDNVG